MRRFSRAAIAALFLAASLPAAGSCGADQVTQADTEVTMPSQARLLVRFEDDVSEDRIAEINKRLGARVINRMSGGRLLLVEVPYAGALRQIQDAYSATEGVRYAEPDLEVSIPPMPGDGNDADGQNDPRGGEDAGAIGIPPTSD
ncbi:MAG: hypothetical protein M5U09_10095 [Gammaproteobacteria bacterium]|nr:hypothetical protein [Gammaproteobacteria bacterium]